MEGLRRWMLVIQFRQCPSIETAYNGLNGTLHLWSDQRQRKSVKKTDRFSAFEFGSWKF